MRIKHITFLLLITLALSSCKIDNEGEKPKLKLALPFTENIYEAAASGNIKRLEYLIKKGADVNGISTSNKTPLIEAAVNNQAEAFKLLIEKGADPSFSPDKEPVFYKASRNANIEIMQLIPIKNCSRVFESLLIALRFNPDPAVAKRLIDTKCPRKPQEICLWNYALDNPSPELVQYLLDNKIVGLTRCAKNTQQALSLAALKGNEAAVKLFIERGAKINSTDDKGYTALHYAVSSGNKNIERILREAGAKTTKGRASTGTPSSSNANEGSCLIMNSAGKMVPCSSIM